MISCFVDDVPTLRERLLGRQELLPVLCDLRGGDHFLVYGLVATQVDQVGDVASVFGDSLSGFAGRRAVGVAGAALQGLQHWPIQAAKGDVGAMMAQTFEYRQAFQVQVTPKLQAWMLDQRFPGR